MALEQQEKEGTLRDAAKAFECSIIPALNPRDAVLDLGTGKGHTALALARHFAQVTSIDIEPETIKRADVAAHPSNVRFACMDAHRLEFADASFDAVTCRAAIHHYNDGVHVMEEVRRVLRPGGASVVMDFCFSDTAKRALTPMSKLRETDFARYYTFLEYCELLEKAGLVIDRIWTYSLPRKVAEWMSGIPADFQDRFLSALSSLDERVRAELRLSGAGRDSTMTYRIVEILARKRDAGASTVTPFGGEDERDQAHRMAATLFERAVLADLPSEGAALDLRAWPPYTTLAMARRFDSVHAIDRDGTQLTALEAKIKQAGVQNVECSCGDPHSLRFSDGSFDAVACRAALQYSSSPERMLAEAYRLLKPGGALAFMDFCVSDSAKTSLGLLSRIREEDFVRYYTFHDCCNLLEEAGFVIDSVRTYSLARSVRNWAAVAPESVRDRLADALLSLDAKTLADLGVDLHDTEPAIQYRIIEIVAFKRT